LTSRIGGHPGFHGDRHRCLEASSASSGVSTSLGRPSAPRIALDAIAEVDFGAVAFGALANLVISFLAAIVIVVSAILT
jgi:hypothetical protein